MDSKESSISVSVRVRPFTEHENRNLVTYEDLVFLGDGSFKETEKFKPLGIRNIINVVDDKMLIFDPPETNPLNRMHRKVFSSPNSRIREHRFIFDGLFDMKATQQEVFENTTKPLLDSILDGFNATAFAYGATGCGKTHTISGTPNDPGIIFLTMKELYNKIEDMNDDIIEITLSFLEIYNETIKDLLNPVTNNKRLAIREDANKKVTVSNLSVHSPQNVEEVMNLIIEGNKNRTCSPTEANLTSSRSHAVLQINISKKKRSVDLVEEHTYATLSIIDLAGSERAAATKNRGQRLNEGANINKSLLALGNCINALCDPRKSKHIPYRDSKLTRLLKFSLGGNCKTCMIVCVSPSSTHYDETLNTLKYANRAKEIKTKLTRNQHNLDRHVGSYLKMITQQKQEIEELKNNQLATITNAAQNQNLKNERNLNLIIENISTLKQSVDQNQDKWKKYLLLSKRKILLIQKNDCDNLLKYLNKENSSVINLVEQLLSKVTLQIRDLENQYNKPDETDFILKVKSGQFLNNLQQQELWSHYHTTIFETLLNDLRDHVEREILFNSSILFDQLIMELQEYNFSTFGLIDVLNNGNNKENMEFESTKLVGILENLINGEFDQFLEAKASQFFARRLESLEQKIHEDLKRGSTSPLKMSPPRSVKKLSRAKSSPSFRSRKVHFESVESDMSVDESILKSDLDDDSPLQNNILHNLDDLDLKLDSSSKISPQINKIVDYKRRPKRITSLRKLEDRLLLNKASKVSEFEIKEFPNFSFKSPSELLNFHGDGSRGADSQSAEKVE